MRFIKKFINSIPLNIWVIIIASFISIIACVFFYNVDLHLGNFDAQSRLNIARKVTDNLTPGLGQFGSVWPFLPQLIMVPFAAITPLWQSGIAGMLMSAPAFILSGLLIFLILMELTKDKFISFIGFLIFATNINLLILQTMAMSEVLFISLTLGAMYFLLQWVKNPTKSILPLAFAGICLSGASLTRYEGIVFTIATVILVFVITFLKKNSLKIAEGVTILFTTIAFFGVFLWCLYNAAIFHDPFNWVKIYTGQTPVISTEKKEIINTNSSVPASIFPQRATSYMSAVAEVNGIPIFIISIIGFGFFIFSLRPLKNQKQLIILLPLSVVAFMLYVLYKSTYPLDVPALNFDSIKNFNNTFTKELNIRYGTLLWPFLVIMTAWLLSKNKSVLFKILAIVVLCIHIATPLYHKAFLIYQFPLEWTVSTTRDPEEKALRWLKANYDDGLIMISALKHDQIMFRLGHPYKTYIHEGTGKYWLTSRDNPEIYAKWILMNDPNNIRGMSNGPEDPVTKHLGYTKVLKTNYIQRYNDGIVNIYQRRDEFSKKLQTSSLDGMFTGRIVDQKGNPIPNVALTTNGVATLSTINGDFALSVNNEPSTITFVKSGYEALTINLDFSESILYAHKMTMTPVREKTVFEKILPYL